MANIAVVIDDGFDEDAYAKTLKALRDDGHVFVFVGRGEGIPVMGKTGSSIVQIQESLSPVSTAEWDALMLLDGNILEGSDHDTQLISLVRGFLDSRKPVFANWASLGLLARSGIARERRVAGPESLIRNPFSCGVQFIDQSFVIDRNLISCRDPKAFPIFLKASLAKLILGNIRLLL